MDPYCPHHAKLDDPSYFAARAECELDHWERDSWNAPHEDRQWSEQRLERLALALDGLAELFALARRDDASPSSAAEQHSHWHDWHDWLGWRFLHRLWNRGGAPTPSLSSAVALPAETRARATVDVERTIVPLADGRAHVLPEAAPARATARRSTAPLLDMRSDGHPPTQLSR